MTRKLGVLPNPVNKDPRSETALVFATLAEGIDQDTAKQWLTGLGALVETLETPVKRTTLASAVIALGPRFFTRFPELAANSPAGFAAPVTLQGETLNADAVLHVSYISEATLATFLDGLWKTRPTLASIEVEHGYSRDDGREASGQLDGLRNLTRPQRTQHTTIDPADLPEEPAWLKGGSYGAWMKIEQNLDTWAGLDATTREQIIGRREADGSRTDLPAGSNPHVEGPFSDPSTPPVTSHVRKTGPRGPLHDQTLIFRRGAPYVEEDAGVLHRGLQFVSYQASLDDLDIVLNHWMFNPDFPGPGAGQDALLNMGLLTFLRSSTFVVVPADSRFPGAGYFDPPPAHDKPRKARIHIRKSVVDANGAPVKAERGDIEFTLIDVKTNSVIGSPATTNSAGRAILTGAKVGRQVIVRETPNPKFQPPQDVTVDVTQRNQIVRITNQLMPSVPGYGG